MPKIPAELFAPLPPVTMPGGRDATVYPISNWAKRILAEKGANLTVDELRAIMRQIAPDMTDAEWDALTEAAALWIVAYASGRAEIAEQLVEDTRKNALGGTRENASGIPPSSPTISSPTCVPESPEPSPAPGDTATSSVSPITKRSSRSTRSKKSSGSTTSSPTLSP